MLVGPGGVVALVIGAWGVLWALRRTAGRPFRAWYAELVAFAGGLYGSALLTVHSTAVLGILAWVRAEPEQRALLASQTLGALPRPLGAATVGLLAIGAVVLAVRARAPAPDAEPVPLRAVDVLLCLVIAGSTAAGLVVAGLLWGEAESAMTTLRAAKAAGPLLQVLAVVGTAAVALDLLASVLVGFLAYRRG